MTKEKRISEEEVRRREREAFAQGAAWRSEAQRPTTDEFYDESRKRYPIRREVPRKVSLDPEFETIAYVASDGALMFEHYRTREPADKCRLSPKSVEIIRDLLEHPTMTVEE